MSLFAQWRAAGFGPEIIPVCGPDHGCESPGKRPHLPGWQDLVITPAILAPWARTHRGNIGLRTRLFPAIDIDVDDQPIAEHCERLALLTLGSTACRTRANTSRRLLLYRLESEPFGKATITFTVPSGTKSRVEVLGGGQQAVVAGVHHSGAAIEWRGGQPAAADLAPMSAAARDDFLVALRGRLVELGCVITAGDEPERRPQRRAYTHHEGHDRVVAELALYRLDPDVEYEQWVRVGMALHSKWPDGSGLALWDSWSARGEKYPGTRSLERHWASFHTDKGVGFGTLIAMARRVGR
jgi:hypothetical protein